MKKIGVGHRKYLWSLPLIITLLAPGGPTFSKGATFESQPNNCDLWLAVCFQQSVSSEHFVIFYDTEGRFAVTPQWAMNVSEMAEAAYSKLVLEDGFTAPARNPIPIYLDLANGGFTNYLRCDLCPVTPTSLGNLQIEYRYKSPCPEGCGIPTSNWEVAHEFFHTIQFTQFNGSLPYGRWFAEGSANWAGYEVTGNESRWDPWGVSAWLGPDGTTDKRLDQRSYDNAFLFVFLSDHYGGPEFVRVMMSIANRTVSPGQAIVKVLDALGYHKTFAGVMKEFGEAMVTGNFTDVDGANAVLRGTPPVAAEALWTGANQTITTFTNSVNGFTAGQHLYVGDRGGIEFVEIRFNSSAALSADLVVQNASCFDFGTVVAPGTYDRTIVTVARGVCGDGEFALKLSPAPASPGISAATSFEILMLGWTIVLASVAGVRLRRNRKSGRDLADRVYELNTRDEAR